MAINVLDFTLLGREVCNASSTLHFTQTGEGFNVTRRSGSGKLQVQFENGEVFFDYFDFTTKVAPIRLTTEMLDEALVSRALAPFGSD